VSRVQECAGGAEHRPCELGAQTWFVAFLRIPWVAPGSAHSSVPTNIRLLGIAPLDRTDRLASV
jgi:hypothetical protein